MTSDTGTYSGALIGESLQPAAVLDGFTCYRRST
jgi:hypothetical protein